MPFILDTDIISILQTRSQPAYDRLRGHLNQYPPLEICATTISLQEQMQGFSAQINRARAPAALLRAYQGLMTTFRYYCAMTVLPFDQGAQDRFIRLRSQRVRIGTMDLRIACIALARSATLVTRNLRDFRQVPGLLVDDWSR